MYCCLQKKEIPSTQCHFYPPASIAVTPGQEGITGAGAWIFRRLRMGWGIIAMWKSFNIGNMSMSGRAYL